MTDQILAEAIAQLAFALSVLARNGQGTEMTPLTVRVNDIAGEVTYAGEDVYYAVASVAYDRQRDEYVLTIDQSAPALGACEFTLSHTRAWCGNPRCRER